MKLDKRDVTVVDNPEFRMLNNRVGLFNSSYQDFKRYGIPKAQLILTDIPYSLGDKAYGSNPSWYIDGDNKNGESDKAGETFFVTDENFKPAEFMHFAAQMLKPEQKGKVDYGFNHYINLVFRKNYSAQVLKANMKIVGNCEYGLVLYRDKLPKFNNNGTMVFNCMDWQRALGMPRIHETQKPIPLLQRLIELFTDPDDVVIDPCAGSGSTLIAAANLGRKAYGLEISKRFYVDARDAMQNYIQPDMFAMQESRYYQRKMAQEQTLALDI